MELCWLSITAAKMSGLKYNSLNLFYQKNRHDTFSSPELDKLEITYLSYYNSTMLLRKKELVYSRIENVVKEILTDKLIYLFDFKSYVDSRSAPNIVFHAVEQWQKYKS